MSPPPLGSQSTSILGSVTPTVDLTPRDHRSSKPAFETSGSWTAPFRDGLPTPPSDMTGVTYNAMPSVAYGGKPHGSSSHLYGYSRPQYDSISSSMVAAMKPNHSAPAKEPATEAPPKKSTGKTGSSQQVPSSIRKSEGNLAEFAAQVRLKIFMEVRDSN